MSFYLAPIRLWLCWAACLWFFFALPADAADHYPDPVSNIHWVDSGGLFNNNYLLHDDGTASINGGASVSTIADIEAAYNNARRTEETQTGLSNNALGILDLPSEAIWQSYTAAEKALFLLNAERTARGILPYKGVLPALQEVAQNFAQHSVEHNIIGHVGADGRTFGDRLSEETQLVGCYQAVTENITYHALDAISIPVEVSVYRFLYASANNGVWGHRHALLQQFDNDLNDNANEGFIGVGVADDLTFYFPEHGGGTAVVLVLLDPKADVCAWPGEAVITATPTQLPPTPTQLPPTEIALPGAATHTAASPTPEQTEPALPIAATYVAPTATPTATPTPVLVAVAATHIAASPTPSPTAEQLPQAAASIPLAVPLSHTAAQGDDGRVLLFVVLLLLVSQWAYRMVMRRVL